MHKKLWGWVVKFEQKINRTIIKEEKEKIGRAHV